MLRYSKRKQISGFLELQIGGFATQEDTGTIVE